MLDPEVERRAPARPTRPCGSGRRSRSPPPRTGSAGVAVRDVPMLPRQSDHAGSTSPGLELVSDAEMTALRSAAVGEISAERERERHDALVLMRSEAQAWVGQEHGACAKAASRHESRAVVPFNVMRGGGGGIAQGRKASIVACRKLRVCVCVRRRGLDVSWWLRPQRAVVMRLPWHCVSGPWSWTSSPPSNNSGRH